jgi:hypothetical protein
MTSAEYDRQVSRFLNDEGRMPTQQVTCFECNSLWISIPRGFIYDDPGAGWRQDPYGQFISGYCQPCADGIATADHEDHVNGNWERRTIEDEMYVWTR